MFRRDSEFCKERLSLVKSDTFPLWVITNAENSSLGYAADPSWLFLYILECIC